MRHPAGNYTKELEEDYFVYAAISQLQAVILANETQCEAFKAQFGKFDHLWKKDLTASLQVASIPPAPEAISSWNIVICLCSICLQQSVAHVFGPGDQGEKALNGHLQCFATQNTSSEPAVSHPDIQMNNLYWQYSAR